eukprot:1051998_1
MSREPCGTDDVFAKIPMEELLQSVYPPAMLLTFAYIRDNGFEIPTPIIQYIALFGFYVRPYKYKSDFDRNGIIYAITKREKSVEGLIRLHTMVSDTFTRYVTRTKMEYYYFAYPSKTSWFSIDFGANKKIKPSRYTLMHDNGVGCSLRNWNFEGSNDGINWCVLRKHQNDTNLNCPHATYTWAIDGDQYYQMFRVFMTGLNSDGGQSLNSEDIEIYGHLVTDVLHYLPATSDCTHHIGSSGSRDSNYKARNRRNNGRNSRAYRGINNGRNRVYYRGSYYYWRKKQ